MIVLLLYDYCVIIMLALCNYFVIIL